VKRWKIKDEALLPRWLRDFLWLLMVKHLPDCMIIDKSVFDNTPCSKCKDSKYYDCRSCEL